MQGMRCSTAGRRTVSFPGRIPAAFWRALRYRRALPLKAAAKGSHAFAGRLSHAPWACRGVWAIGEIFPCPALREGLTAASIWHITIKAVSVWLPKDCTLAWLDRSRFFFCLKKETGRHSLFCAARFCRAPFSPPPRPACLAKTLPPHGASPRKNAPAFACKRAVRLL